MQVLNISGLAMIFAVVRLTTSTVLGQRWATKPYETPGGYTRPAMQPNIHAPHIHKRPLSVSTSTMSSQHPHRPEHHQPVTVPDQADAEENTVPLVMTGDMIEDNSMAGEQEANIHKHPHTGMTSTMPGQHSSPVTTETMTVDHPEHQQHQHLPVMTQKPGLSNAPDSVEAMIEEMSEHDEMISISVHEFKEVLHELVKDTVDKIVMKKAGILGKLKTAKQNLIGHNGEATGRDPQQSSRPACGFGGLVQLEKCLQLFCKHDPHTILTCDDL